MRIVIRRYNSCMLITLTGENDFVRGEALQAIIAAFKEQNDELSLEIIDCEEADMTRIHEAMTGLPLFSQKKLVVLREPGKNKQFAEQAATLFDLVPETTDTVIVEPKPDKRSTYYKLLKKQTDYREFPKPDHRGVVNWLMQTAKAAGAVLSAADANYLIERVGSNQQLLHSELQKLTLHNPQITRQTINLLTEPTPQSSIFEMMETAFAGKADRALRLYADQRAQKVEPLKILAMLSWQLQVLALIKTSGGHKPEQVAREAKLNPYVVSKSQRLAADISLPELKKHVADLLKIDVMSKTTAFDTDQALQNYILGLAKTGR